MACLLVAAACGDALAADPIDLGSRRELFVDGYLIDKLTGAELRLQTPRDEGVAFALDKPWEGKFSAYTTIIHDGDKYRAYYRGLPEARKDGTSRESTCYAESIDGKTWTNVAANELTLPSAAQPTVGAVRLINSNVVRKRVMSMWW